MLYHRPSPSESLQHHPALPMWLLRITNTPACPSAPITASSAPMADAPRSDGFAARTVAFLSTGLDTTSYVEKGRRTQLKPSALMFCAMAASGCWSRPLTTKDSMCAPYQLTHDSCACALRLSIMRPPKP